MSSNISDNAIIRGDVKLGNNVHVSDYSIIEGNVLIGDNVIIGSSTHIKGPIKIGKETVISDFVSIGTPPQHSSLKFDYNETITNNEERKILIGEKVIIREFTTVHKPITEMTQIGDDCYIMAYNHISHDTKIDKNVILANNTQIGGYTTILHNSNIGLNTTIHQESTIGSYSMIGMGSVINRDIPPFLLSIGNPIKVKRVDKFGLEKHKFTNDQINEVQDFYKKMKESSMDLLNKDMGSEFIKNEISLFIESRRNNRRIISL